MIRIGASLLVCLYVVGFLTLSMLAARIMGRSVWLFGAGDPQQRWTGLAFRAAFLGALLWPGHQVWQGRSIGLFQSGLLSHSGVVSTLGAVLIAVGGSFALVSQYHMGAAWRIGAAEGQQGQLVVTGPFRWSRNPVFVGQSGVFLGLLLVFPDPVQFAVTAVALLAIRAQVRIEEPVLRATFGAVYEDYARRVPRWIGGVSSHIVPKRA